MTTRRGIDLQPDLFVPMLSDLQLRDQRETMERPFFSLCKRRRLAPIAPPRLHRPAGRSTARS